MKSEPNIETKVGRPEGTRGLVHDVVVGAVGGVAAGAGGAAVNQIANRARRSRSTAFSISSAAQTASAWCDGGLRVGCYQRVSSSC